FLCNILSQESSTRRDMLLIFQHAIGANIELLIAMYITPSSILIHIIHPLSMLSQRENFDACAATLSFYQIKGKGKENWFTMENHNKGLTAEAVAFIAMMILRV
ncbi:hypothetical protein ACJX0J_016425, partial [Zea mays]